MGDRLVALPGCLVASWRGVPFHVPDVSSPAGRRIVSIDLPGTDVTLHEDLGLATGAIRVEGMMVGDDVVAMAQAMQAACETAGPGTLVHPWLGAMTAILREPADIRFEAAKLRTVSLRMTFERWSGSTAVSGGLATLAAIADAVVAVAAVGDELVGLAADLLDDLASVATGLLAHVETAIAGSIAGGDLSTILATSRAVISAAAIDDGAGLAAWMGSVATTIAGAGVPPTSPAIGIGPLGRATEAAVDPWSVVVALIAIAETTAAASLVADGDGESSVLEAMAITALRNATDPLAAVEWESRQQALAARAELSAALATVAEAAIGASTASETTATIRRESWRRLAALRRAIHQDLDDRIGRLPSVMTVMPPTRVSAWIVAQHLFGDDPNAVRSGFEDIVKRNRLAHPSICDVDPIEVLPQ